MAHSLPCEAGNCQACGLNDRAVALAKSANSHDPRVRGTCSRQAPLSSVLVTIRCQSEPEIKEAHDGPCAGLPIRVFDTQVMAEARNTAGASRVQRKRDLQMKAVMTAEVPTLLGGQQMPMEAVTGHIQKPTTVTLAWRSGLEILTPEGSTRVTPMANLVLQKPVVRQHGMKQALKQQILDIPNIDKIVEEQDTPEETNVYKQKAAEMKLERARSKCPRHQEQNCDEITPEALALGLVTEDFRIEEV
ncbi:hypothetical protein AK812_SmicGene38221 [Symbiodinium microadriaticum]|uniref:Uncharacterized protein n=1 Tax=Symbiodinium microadriaticum TaxID=2951 RepID=A0A1Q9CEC6_SYMMI|nr:hypothetical protein AK812_SmicGene38221 [Symbiodinium microadriaticum]